MTTNGCAAPAHLCGTPTGWRSGGRCPECRAAHNEETRRYRGLRPAQRQQVLDLLRAGFEPAEAAREVRRSVQSLTAAARHDAELRAALDGRPVKAQRRALAGQFLAQLALNGGSARDAARAMGLEEGDNAAWRREDPLYAAAEDAVLTWIRGTRPAQRGWTQGEALDQAAALLEQGVGITRAALAVGMTTHQLRLRAAESARLAAALPEPGTRAGSPEAFGEKKTVAEWAKDPRCRVSFNALDRRLRKGWPLEEALTTPASPGPSRHRLIEAFGERRSVTEWADDPRCQVAAGTLYSRLYEGWPPEKAITTPSRRKKPVQQASR